MMPKTTISRLARSATEMQVPAGRNKIRSSQRDNDMGIIANHRAVQGCALQMGLFTHVATKVNGD